MEGNIDKQRVGKGVAVGRRAPLRQGYIAEWKALMKQDGNDAVAMREVLMKRGHSYKVVIDEAKASGGNAAGKGMGEGEELLR